MNKLNSIFKNYIVCLIGIFAMFSSIETEAKGLNLGRILSGAQKVFTAVTLSDDDVVSYVREYVVYLDSQNDIAPEGNEYAKRLATLTEGLNQVDGMPLNFKVYITPEVNAFACADGSVRVYSGLMDLMNDDEVLGVIGHEIGHVAHKDTKKGLKQSLLNSALFDGIASTGDTAAALTDSQLGAIGEAMLNSKYSRKQETNADDYGYDFLKKNGKNPWIMAMAFTKLQQLESSSKAGFLTKMFSTHPQTPDRIKHIADKCKKDRIPKPEGCNL